MEKLEKAANRTEKIFKRVFNRITAPDTALTNVNREGAYNNVKVNAKEQLDMKKIAEESIALLNLFFTQPTNNEQNIDLNNEISMDLTKIANVFKYLKNSSVYDIYNGKSVLDVTENIARYSASMTDKIRNIMISEIKNEPNKKQISSEDSSEITKLLEYQIYVTSLVHVVVHIYALYKFLKKNETGINIDFDIKMIELIILLIFVNNKFKSLSINTTVSKPVNDLIQQYDNTATQNIMHYYNNQILLINKLMTFTVNDKVYIIEYDRVLNITNICNKNVIKEFLGINSPTITNKVEHLQNRLLSMLKCTINKFYTIKTQRFLNGSYLSSIYNKYCYDLELYSCVVHPKKYTIFKALESNIKHFLNIMDANQTLYWNEAMRSSENNCRWHRTNTSACSSYLNSSAVVIKMNSDLKISIDHCCASYTQKELNAYKTFCQKTMFYIFIEFTSMQNNSLHAKISHKTVMNTDNDNNNENDEDIDNDSTLIVGKNILRNNDMHFEKLKEVLYFDVQKYNDFAKSLIDKLLLAYKQISIYQNIDDIVISNIEPNSFQLIIDYVIKSYVDKYESLIKIYPQLTSTSDDKRPKLDIELLKKIITEVISTSVTETNYKITIGSRFKCIFLQLCIPLTLYMVLCLVIKDSLIIKGLITLPNKKNISINI